MITTQNDKLRYKTVFNYAIDVDGDITEDQRQKLQQVARTCPVHKTLSKEIVCKPMAEQCYPIAE